MAATGGSHPAERYNYVIGTQTIGSLYQFTGETRLIETAEAILGMGSNLIKFRIDSQFDRDNYAGPDPIRPGSIRDLVSRDPSIRTVLDMPFYYYFLWVNEPFSLVDVPEWQSRYCDRAAEAEYEEIYEVSCYLLRTYSGSGKSFYIGNWEGDWMLLGHYDRTADPEPYRIDAMARRMNTRQRAVDDAKQDTPHERVDLYHYMEVNLVEKGVRGRPCMVTEVLPRAPVDYVSYSAYEIGFDQDLASALRRTFGLIEENLSPKQGVPEPRVFIGEFGYKGAVLGEALHKTKSVEFIRAALEQGCPFVLYWQMYCNELEDGEYNGFWLIDHEGREWPLFDTMRASLSRVREFVSGHAAANNGDLPDPEATRRYLRALLEDAEEAEPARFRAGKQQLENEGFESGKLHPWKAGGMRVHALRHEAALFARCATGRPQLSVHSGSGIHAPAGR